MAELSPKTLDDHLDTSLDDHLDTLRQSGVTVEDLFVDTVPCKGRYAGEKFFGRLMLTLILLLLSSLAAAAFRPIEPTTDEALAMVINALLAAAGAVCVHTKAAPIGNALEIAGRLAPELWADLPKRLAALRRQVTLAAALLLADPAAAIAAALVEANRFTLAAFSHIAYLPLAGCALLLWQMRRDRATISARVAATLEAAATQSSTEKE